MWPDRIIIRVCPSGFAATSAAVAVEPFAPGRFSITTGAPSTFSSSLAMSREIMSAVPPGGNPTSQRIGPEGQVCAAAAPASHRLRVSAAISAHRVPPESSCDPCRFRCGRPHGAVPGKVGPGFPRVLVKACTATKTKGFVCPTTSPSTKASTSRPARLRRSCPACAAFVADNRRAVHLQGHAHLHRRQGQGRDHRSGAGRSEHTSRRCSMRCAARP